MRTAPLAAALLSLAVSFAAAPPAPPASAPADLPQNSVWLDALAIDNINQGYGSPRARRSVDNKPLTLHNTQFRRGVGTHAPAEIKIVLDAKAIRFVATVGIDDEVGNQGSFRLIASLDGKQIHRSEPLAGGGTPAKIDVDLTGGKELTLTLSDEGNMDFDHVDLANAYITLTPAAAADNFRPAINPAAPEDPITLPRTLAADGSPRLTGPRIASASPGRPFLFRIPSTGAAPLSFSAENLPAGLTLDPATGILTGTLSKPLSTAATITVKNAKGTATRPLVIAAGPHKLLLTPPMGWNSWNVWGTAIDQEKTKAAADAFIKAGLADHGFSYINIDDGWELKDRAADGTIQTNEKFPDMKGLGDYLHARGLKFGIYSSPGPQTCARYTGSYQHEEQDAHSWASWGVDYIKYDWCSYSQVAGRNPDLAAMKKPYQVLRAALDKQNRDIAYSLCQYGMGSVWNWGDDADIKGNLWRTTGDITDTWRSMSTIGFGQNGKETGAGPGHWNDPDMLVVGKVGWGPRLRTTKLTQNEQLTHISLWSILAAPLLIGCDMTQLDEFTTAVLTNDEVLAVNQDPLGKQGKRLSQTGETQIWTRTLIDGTTAVGLFNLGSKPAEVTLNLSELNLSGPQPARDLWQLKDLAPITATYTATVPRHGVTLLKVGTPKPEAQSTAALVQLHAP